MRTKIIAGNLIAVLLVGLSSYFWVRGDLERRLVSDVDHRVSSDFQLLDRSFRLSASELSRLVSERAGEENMAEIFLATTTETARRTRAYESANQIAGWLADPQRRGSPPDIVVITDDTGRVVARNADRNRMYNDSLSTAVPAVTRAMAGEPSHGVWLKADENKVLQIAAAPIRAEGRVVGTLVVGYDLSNGLARAESALLGRDVAFVLHDRVYSSSLPEGTEALSQYLFGPGQGATAAALTQDATSSLFAVQINGQEYAAMVGPAPGHGNTELAMVVLANRSAEAAKVGILVVILALTVVGVLIVLIYGFLIGTSFLRPIEQMEEGVLAVINGRTDTRLDIQSAEYGGLAYRINQLLNVFTGTPEEDEQGRVSTAPAGTEQAWDDTSQVVQQGGGEATASSVGASAAASSSGAESDAEDPALAAQLASEPEDAYYARVYKEYVAAKQSVGEDVSNIPQDKFVQRLRANEQSLIKKHGCKMVRFQVQTRGTQVNLKPVVIR